MSPDDATTRALEAANASREVRVVWLTSVELVTRVGLAAFAGAASVVAGLAGVAFRESAHPSAGVVFGLTGLVGALAWITLAVLLTDDLLPGYHQTKPGQPRQG